MTTNQAPTDLAVSTRVLSPRQLQLMAVQDGMEGGNSPMAIVPRNFAEVKVMCDALAAASLVPGAYKDKPQDMIVVVMSGAELGLPPMQSLRLYHIIEGIPRLSSEGIRGVVLANHLCEFLEAVESSEKRAVWRGKRRGRPEQTVTWTIERAQRANLIRNNRDGSPGMWGKYPEEMLLARGGAQICRMIWPDIAAGLVSREEALDGDVIGDVIGADFVETKTAVVFAAPPPAQLPAEVMGRAATPVADTAPGRGARGARAARVVDVESSPVGSTPPPSTKLDAAVAEAQQQPTAAVVPSKLDAAVAHVEQKAAAPAPEVAPAPADDGFGAAPAPGMAEMAEMIDGHPASIEGFTRWCASRETSDQLTKFSAPWRDWNSRVHVDADGQPHPSKAIISGIYSTRRAELEKLAAGPSAP